MAGYQEHAEAFLPHGWGVVPSVPEERAQEIAHRVERLQAVADTLIGRIEEQAEIGDAELLGDLSYALVNILSSVEYAS